MPKHMPHPPAAQFDFTQDRHLGVFVCTRVAEGAPVLYAGRDAGRGLAVPRAADAMATTTPATPGLLWCLEHVVARRPVAQFLCDKNHLEACYCVSGRGDIEDLATGAVHLIAPGTVYALDRHDRHTLRASADEDMRLICVFYPALRGTETHGPDGSYS